MEETVSKEYPDEMIRGIPVVNDITSDGYIAESAFRFQPPKEERMDDYHELSINWKDDDRSIPFTLSQSKVKDGQEIYQFRAGYCIIPISRIHDNMKMLMDRNQFKYERKPIEEDQEKGVKANPYHGNLLLHKDVSTALKKNIQCALALIASEKFTRRENEQ